MLAYAVRKVLTIIPIVFGVALIAFLIMHLAPGNPAQIMAGPDAAVEDIEVIERRLGLDQPLHVQFLSFMANAARGDFGRSIRTNRPVTEEILARLPYTVQLAASALFVAIVVGIPLGVFAAVKQNTWFDSGTMVAALFGLSMPSFWRGLMAMLLFAYLLGWFPASGMSGTVLSPEWFRHMTLPAVSLGIGTAATIARLTRSSMLEVIREDYIRTARSKGISERRITYKHALRNALIPVVTVVGLSLGVLMGGSIITESVFAFPGVGTLAINAISARDFPAVQGVVMTVATIFVLVNLLVDLTYGWLDPRIRYD